MQKEVRLLHACTRVRCSQSVQRQFAYWQYFRRVSTLQKHNTQRTNLVSVYDDQGLHGFQRGANAFFTQPLESWLSILSNAVPFIHDCLVVAPSTMTSQRLRALLHRAQAHFPQVHVTQLKRNANVINFQRQNDNLQRASSHAASTSCLSAPLRLFASPLQQLTQKSLDVIVFADNVFGNEMFFDSPWHISLAAKALRPHGVLALLGYNTQIQIVNPTWAKENVMDYLKAHRQNVLAAITEKQKVQKMYWSKRKKTTTTPVAHCTAALSENSNCTNEDKNVSNLMNNSTGADLNDDKGNDDNIFSSRQFSISSHDCDDDNAITKKCCERQSQSSTRQTHLFTALRRAWEAQCSINTGHADTYIPFLATRRAWFLSQYALTPSSLIAYLRTLPTYDLLHKLQNYPVQIHKHQQQWANDITADFIDVQTQLGNSGECSVLYKVKESKSSNTQSNISCSATNESKKDNTIKAASVDCNKIDISAPLFVHRRANEVGHLQALYYCLCNHLHESEAGNLILCQQQHQKQVRVQPCSLLNAKQAHSAFPPLRARIRHFTVSCSNRSMNSIDKFNKFVNLPTSTDYYLHK